MHLCLMRNIANAGRMKYCLRRRGMLYAFAGSYNRQNIWQHWWETRQVVMASTCKHRKVLKNRLVANIILSLQFELFNAIADPLNMEMKETE